MESLGDDCRLSGLLADLLPSGLLADFLPSGLLADFLFSGLLADFLLKGGGDGSLASSFGEERRLLLLGSSSLVDLLLLDTSSVFGLRFLLVPLGEEASTSDRPEGDLDLRDTIVQLLVTACDAAILSSWSASSEGSPCN